MQDQAAKHANVTFTDQLCLYSVLTMILRSCEATAGSRHALQKAMVWAQWSRTGGKDSKPHLEGLAAVQLEAHALADNFCWVNQVTKDSVVHLQQVHEELYVKQWAPPCLQARMMLAAPHLVPGSCLYPSRQ